MKKLRFLLLPFSVMICAQEVDTLQVKELQQELSKDAPKVQTYTLKDGSVRTYPKPKLFDFVTKLPRNFIDTNKDFVAKDHAYYLGGAVASTLILLPFDQKLIDNSRNSVRDGEWTRITITPNLGCF